jgi:uncharacterized membrane protein
MYAKKNGSEIMRECDICKRQFAEDDLISGHGIRHEIESLIQMEFPRWTDKNRICRNDYNKYRNTYITKIIQDETGRIQELKTDVLKSINQNEIITSNNNVLAKEVLKPGDLISDKVAKFGGSWRFIISFFIVLLAWILINTCLILKKPFDPYPFILMNLILSCIAAIQAPVIMMSQNRQEKKDRARSENDYKINLKSEIEIRTLHEKVDHLLLDQWSKMMNIQEIQIEILEEIKRKMEKK